jgi:hypothetical protein
LVVSPGAVANSNSKALFNMRVDICAVMME